MSKRDLSGLLRTMLREAHPRPLNVTAMASALGLSCDRVNRSLDAMPDAYQSDWHQGRGSASKVWSIFVPPPPPPKPVPKGRRSPMASKERRKAPITDMIGTDLHHGDQLIHPDGTTCQVICYIQAGIESWVAAYDEKREIALDEAVSPTGGCAILDFEAMQKTRKTRRKAPKA